MIRNVPGGSLELPRVSVIIPFCNAAQWLPEAIASVLCQSGVSLELLLVDDGSTDGSPDIARDCSDSRVVVLTQSNAGASAARNAALDQARGEFVLFLDADDLLEPDALDVLMQAIGSHDAVFGSFRNFDASGSHAVSYQPLPGESPFATYFRCKPVVSTCLMRRSVIQSRWRTDMKVWEVTEFFFSNLLGASFVFSPACVTAIRQHDHADRVSLRHDHFGAEIMAAYFLDCHARSHAAGIAEDAVSLLARELLGIAYQLDSARDGLARRLADQVGRPFWLVRSGHSVHWFYFVLGIRGFWLHKWLHRMFRHAMRS